MHSTRVVVPPGRVSEQAMSCPRTRRGTHAHEILSSAAGAGWSQGTDDRRHARSQGPDDGIQGGGQEVEGLWEVGVGGEAVADDQAGWPGVGAAVRREGDDVDTGLERAAGYGGVIGAGWQEEGDVQAG